MLWWVLVSECYICTHLKIFQVLRKFYISGSHCMVNISVWEVCYRKSGQLHQDIRNCVVSDLVATICDLSNMTFIDRHVDEVMDYKLNKLKSEQN